MGKTAEALKQVDTQIERLKAEIAKTQREYTEALKEAAKGGGEISDFLKRAGDLMAHEARLRRLQVELQELRWRRVDLMAEVDPWEL